MEIKDGEWCGDMGALGASCFHTLSDEARDIAAKSWDLEREGMVCTKAENFANWKEAILKLCHETGYCTFQEKKMIRAFVDRVERHSRRIRTFSK